jgi:hypothetical protein
MPGKSCAAQGGRRIGGSDSGQAADTYFYFKVSAPTSSREDEGDDLLAISRAGQARRIRGAALRLARRSNVAGRPESAPHCRSAVCSALGDAGQGLE